LPLAVPLLKVGRELNIESVRELINHLTEEGGEHSTVASETLSAALQGIIGDNPDLRKAVLGVLDELTPVFFYFDEYSSLPGRSGFVKY